MAKLRIDQRNQPTREFPLDGDEVTIGRGIGNTLHFRDPWLSRDHARLIVKGEGFVLEDSRSRNGTFLNGEALSGEQPLRHGDVVTLGDVQLTFLDEASTGLHLADSGVSLETRGTVMISSEELRYDSYRDAASSSAGAGPQAADPSVGILPALHNVTSALVRHFPLDELADKVLELVLDAVQADRAALLLRPRGAGAEAASADGEEDAAAGALRVQSRRGYGESDEVRISRTIVRAVLEERKAVLTMDAQSDARFGQAVSIMMQGIRSVVAAPLINTDRQVIGLIYLDDRVSSAVFNEDSLRLIGLIANLAAVKVENCYLLEEQLEKRRMAEQLAVGAQIQRGLLPASDPNIEGYEVCGANRSCFEIGGDYYDFIHKEDGRLALVIADVSGKGVGAALLMAVMQASVRALVDTAADPAELVRRLNRVLVENSPDNKFATFFYAELDTEKHRLSYVSGGHNPSLLWDGEEVHQLHSTGPIVGLVPEAKFAWKSVDMPPGSTLLLYTDGVTELEDPSGQQLDLQPLIDLMHQDSWKSAVDLLEEIDVLMQRFSGGDQLDDDTTLVIARRLD